MIEMTVLVSGNFCTMNVLAHFLFVLLKHWNSTSEKYTYFGGNSSMLLHKDGIYNCKILHPIPVSSLPKDLEVHVYKMYTFALCCFNSF